VDLRGRVGAGAADLVRGMGEAGEVRRDCQRRVSGILPGYSCKEGRIVEGGLLVEFPCTPTRTRSVYSY
jgi:hypothetical protein